LSYLLPLQGYPWLLDVKLGIFLKLQIYKSATNTINIIKDIIFVITDDWKR